MENMCANVLEVCSLDGRKILVMSWRAYQCFSEEQLCQLRNHVDEVLYADLTTIESVGGGSARSMIAELF